VVQTFRSHPSVLYHIRRFVRDCARTTELRPDIVSDLLVAVTEAAANSMLHTASRQIRVTWSELEGCVEVDIQDEGVFRREAPMPQLDGGGHGIPLMMALVDEVTIREGTARKPGTLVRLVKCREP
jgi:anti-sigma regulatory factor (Ser/Thr protein kinase)